MDKKGCWQKHDCPARELYKKMFREDALDQLMPYCDGLKVAQKECPVFKTLLAEHYCKLIMEELENGVFESHYQSNISHYLDDIEKLWATDEGRRAPKKGERRHIDLFCILPDPQAQKESVSKEAE